MEVVSAILGLGFVLIGPAAMVGAVTAVAVRSTRRNLPPAEASRAAMKGFWIAFVITVAVEILLFGLCIAAFTQSG